MKNKVLPYFLGLIASMIFGLSFIFVKSGLEQAEPFVILFYRFLFAFVIFTLLILLRVIKINLRGKSILPLILIGLITPVIDLGAETTALKYITTIESAIYLSLVPIIVMLLSVIFLKKEMSLKQNIFVVISVLGAIVSIPYSSNSFSGSTFGTLLILLGVLGCASYSIVARKLSVNYTPSEITYSMITVGFISFFILSLITKTDTMYNTYIQVLSNKQFITSFLYLSMGCSIIAFFIYNYMYSQISAVSTSVFTNLVTVITVTSGVFILNEKISNIQILGALLIAVGVIGTNIVEYQLQKSKK